MSPTTAAARALTELVDTARALTDQARKRRRGDIAHRLTAISTQLDAARTRLVQDGAEYIEPAWAYVDAGRRAIALYRVAIT